MIVEIYTPDDMREHLAACVRRQLDLDGRSKVEICRAAEFPLKTLERYLTGERWAGAQTLAKLLTALQCSPEKMWAPTREALDPNP